MSCKHLVVLYGLQHCQCGSSTLHYLHELVCLLDDRI
uniref:Similar to EMB2733/ESP3 (EMBRYO DEFECTIVE 2733) n=1 Tax=Arundo donax TaxID=35708 RepID=A0A0A9EQJ2_ARUDO